MFRFIFPKRVLDISLHGCVSNETLDVYAPLGWQTIADTHVMLTMYLGVWVFVQIWCVTNKNKMRDRQKCRVVHNEYYIYIYISTFSDY